MPRLNVVKPEQAAGETRTLYEGIKGAIGAVPNIYQGIGNSPAALSAVLQAGAALDHGSLTAAEHEAIKLVVSEAYSCTYCLAAHTMLGKKAGLTEGQILSIRRAVPASSSVGALVKFVHGLYRPEARVHDDDLAKVRLAGYTDAQITEALLVVSQTVFTNLFNRVNQTALDFPAAPSL